MELQKKESELFQREINEQNTKYLENKNNYEDQLKDKQIIINEKEKVILENIKSNTTISNKFNKLSEK
jgi:hypothetical protein